MFRWGQVFTGLGSSLYGFLFLIVHATHGCCGSCGALAVMLVAVVIMCFFLFVVDTSISTAWLFRLATSLVL